MITPFNKPIYVTKPIAPHLGTMTQKLEEIWEDRWFTNSGRQHQQLEKELLKVLKVSHISLFNNGTIALIVAVQGLRLQGEVITTPFTFPATPHVLSWNNIRPIFCDIDSTTMNIDSEKIESLISPQTTAILGVHVFGTPCKVTQIQEIADRYGLRVIYDAAHAFGTEIDGIGIGNYGDISMFSFHATKLFHTAEGGALTFNEDNLKKRIDYLKNFGIKNEEEVVMPGINGKMNEIQAALGIVMLDYIEDEHRKREEIATIYAERLNGLRGVTCNQPLDGVRRNQQYFVIRINENRFGISRDEVHRRFKEYNIFTRKYFYPLCSDYSCYRQLPSANAANLPIANQVVKEVLCLPLYGDLGLSDVGKICDILEAMKE